ncbi:MAG TPA: hypothetical protein VMS30_08810 [Phycisphaerales bacterium]|nr:hypothetical protein [Phycisphaerales bacterium]
MMIIGAACLSTVLSLVPAVAATDAQPPIDLKVLYLGNAGTPRAKAYEAFLAERFAKATAVDRNSFDPASAAEYDVVLLDWSQSDVNAGGVTPGQRVDLKSPLGPRESWSKPIVMLGSAGLLITSPWQTNGTYGCTCLYPFAYNPRNHEIFNAPISIDRGATIKRPVPNDSWREKLGVGEVDVIPMVRDIDKSYDPGWCTYENTLAEQPEVEFICGGINDKIPAAVGIWRQGNQLHFGFDLSPDDMSDAARAMLVNSIAYIARFTQDRPIVRSPSPFYGVATRARSSVESWLTNDHYDLKWVDDAISPSVLQSVQRRTRAEYLEWYRDNSRYLRPGADGLLTWDEEAKSLEISYSTPELFERGIAALRDPATRVQAATLLHRYAPEGPSSDDAAAWQAWYAENQPYLFYCEWGSYRWYIDPLAKSRGVPTADLRGPARADC